MSAPASTAFRSQDPAPLVCSACTRTLGSTVAFCPFCGAAQQAAVAPAPSPALPDMSAAPVPGIPVAPAPSSLGGKPAPSPRPRPAPSPAPPIQPQAVAKPGAPWRRLAVIASIAIIGAPILRANLAPVSQTRLVVRVHAANGGPVPGGRILIDDRQAGAPGESLVVRPGTLKVAFEEPGWRSEARLVKLVKDAAATIDLTVQEVPGHLTLNTIPVGASVRIRGHLYNQSPLSLDLSPGSYDVAVALNGYASRTVPITLTRGETRNLSIELVPVPLPAAPPPSPPIRFQPAPFSKAVVTASIPLQAGPAANTNVVAIIPAVTEVQVLAQVVADDTWLQVRSNGRQGFIRAGGPLEPWDSWAQRNAAAGPIDLVTPSLKVVIAGSAHPLSGVQMPDRGLSGLARVEAALGGMLKGVQARCTPRDTVSFQCKTADGRDIAELYLLNGGAIIGDGALPYYADAQRTAQEKQKGSWSE